MSAGLWAFVGVVVGGVLTIVGQGVAEWVKALVATHERRDRRAQLSREFQREAMVRLQESMATYRGSLSQYQRMSAPSEEIDAALAGSRVAFQLLLHRVADADVRRAAGNWEAEALRWFQRDDAGTAQLEAGTWEAAMRISGEAIRNTD